ncbi:MAG: Cna B-type domain-containing protein [Eubacteriaceae bacterium]|nr:Cna B-type domain-containing protein [Eubacteriaceae bacterium]
MLSLKQEKEVRKMSKRKKAQYRNGHRRWICIIMAIVFVAGMSTVSMADDMSGIEQYDSAENQQITENTDQEVPSNSDENKETSENIEQSTVVNYDSKQGITEKAEESNGNSIISKTQKTGTKAAETKDIAPTVTFAVASDSPSGKNGAAIKYGDTVKYNIHYTTDSTVAKVTNISLALFGEGFDVVSASEGYYLNYGKDALLWEMPASQPEGDITATIKVKKGGTGAGAMNASVTVTKQSERVQSDVIKTPIIEKGNVGTENPGSDQNAPSVGGANTKGEITSEGQAAAVGDVIPYYITYGNGHETAVNVVITDVIDKGLDVDTNSISDGGVYDNSTRTITWNIQNVPAGSAGLTVTFKATVNSKAVTFVENTAVVKIGNDSGVTSNTVKNPVPEKYYSEDTPSGYDGAEVRIGDIVKYRITYGNEEDNPATVTIKDPLDKNVEYVEGSASAGGVYDAGTHAVNWTINNVEKGTYGEVSFSVKVKETTAEKIENTAYVTIGNHPEIQTQTLVNPITYKKYEDVSVEKVWKGDKKAERPESIEVQLYNGSTAEGETVVLNEGNSWKYTWKDLDENGDWSVDEVSVPEGYGKTVTNSGTNYVITNKKITANNPKTPDDNDTSNNSNTPKKISTTKTDDSFDGSLAIMIMLISGVICVGTAVKRHRKNI